MNFEGKSDFPKNASTKLWMYAIGFLLCAMVCAYAPSVNFDIKQIFELIEFALLAFCLVVTVFAAFWKFSQIKSLRTPRPLKLSVTLNDSRLEQNVGKMVVSFAYKDIVAVRFDSLDLESEIAIFHLNDGQIVVIKGLAEQATFREQLKTKVPHAL